MSKHTAGPWTGWYTSSGSGIAWAIGPEGCSPCVALVDDDPDGGLTDGATIEANARLIAAAPELLAVTRQLLLLVRPGSALGQRTLAVIAKAEGHPPAQGTPPAS